MSKTVVCRNSHTGISVEVPSDKLEFRPSVYAVMLHNDNILLIKFKDGWLLPGGAIDTGETLEEALRREVSEETGLKVAQDELLHFEEDFVQSFNRQRYFHALRWYFLCTEPSGELTVDGFTHFEKENMQMPEWVPIEKALTLMIHHPIDPVALIRKAVEMKV
jgi:8-oxo-dGTP diphosphatase